MLEGLDSIDWQHLTHAYGPATDVPDLIHALASTDKQIREQAHHELCGNIWHQGTIYQATAYAVPFLIELLTYESVEDKAGILALLSHIAMGSSGLDVHGDLPFYDEQRNTLAFKAQLAQELDWVKRAYVAVGEGMPIYLDLLADADAETRMFAAHLLSCYKEHAQTSAPKLIHLLTRENDDQVQAAVLLSLGALSEPESPQLEHLRPYIRSDAPALLRFAAALAFARCTRDDTPPEIVQALVQGVADAEAIDELYGQLPWFSSVIPDACEALTLIEQTLAIAALIDVLQTLDNEEHAWDRVGVAESLLDLAFYGRQVPKDWAYGKTKSGRLKIECWNYPGQPHRSGKQQGVQENRSRIGLLTKPQRTALTAVAKYGPLWEIDTNLFEVYGLPNSREALRKLLE